jgi:hypothetical protein
MEDPESYLSKNRSVKGRIAERQRIAQQRIVAR